MQTKQTIPLLLLFVAISLRLTTIVYVDLYGLPMWTILSNQNFVGKIVLLHAQTMHSWSKFLYSLYVCICKPRFHGQTATLHGQTYLPFTNVFSWAIFVFAFANTLFMVQLNICICIYFHVHDQKARYRTGKFFHVHLFSACSLKLI